MSSKRIERTINNQILASRNVPSGVAPSSTFSRPFVRTILKDVLLILCFLLFWKAANGEEEIIAALAWVLVVGTNRRAACWLKPNVDGTIFDNATINTVDINFMERGRKKEL